MGKSPKMPDPINPWDMAEAQSHYNRLNTYGPNGSVIYGHVGDDGQFVEGPGGRDQQQAVQTEETEFQRNLREGKERGALGVQTAVMDAYGNGANLPDVPQIEDQNAIAQDYFDANKSLVSRHFGRDQDRMMGKLQNRGLPVGSEAYEAGMQPVLDSQNNAMQGLAARSMAYAGGEQSRRYGLGRSARDSALNEMQGVANGSFTPSPLVQSGGTAGINIDQYMQNNHSQQVQNAQAAADRRSAGIGGLFSLASMIPSDRRVKEDIKPAGKTAGGHNLYTYRYKGGVVRHMGVMAQEVMQALPEAVKRLRNGLMVVDYSKIA